MTDTEQTLEFQWGEFRVEARGHGSLWTGELYEHNDSVARHAFELDVGRSLDNLIGMYELPNRLELAKLVAVEAYKLKKRSAEQSPG